MDGDARVGVHTNGIKKACKYCHTSVYALCSIFLILVIFSREHGLLKGEGHA